LRLGCAKLRVGSDGPALGRGTLAGRGELTARELVGRSGRKLPASVLPAAGLRIAVLPGGVLAAGKLAACGAKLAAHGGLARRLAARHSAQSAESRSIGRLTGQQRLPRLAGLNRHAHRSRLAGDDTHLGHRLGISHLRTGVHALLVGKGVHRPKAEPRAAVAG
jgi:hypothetical protein